MSRIARRYKKSPVVRELALKLVRNLPSKDWPAEARAIFRFARDNIRYTKDIRGCETVQSPVQTLRLAQGDCDDHSVLIASLLLSIGHPVRFVAVGFTKNSLTHVFPQTPIGNKWLTMDATMKDWPMGRSPKKVKNKMIENVRD